MSLKLGEPRELPWWAVLFAVPPVGLMVAGPFVPAPLAARLLAVIGSVITLGLLLRITTRVTSPSMQTVYISALYAVWVMVAIGWAAAIGR